ncbi:hypothetical protein DFJ74DRAFT_700616 [Hyaloraphidium curvatum]|nr:hypothetical protein DFJ74DRAFT_700616 [Hyaloraphidium curvatum]
MRDTRALPDHLRLKLEAPEESGGTEDGGDGTDIRTRLLPLVHPSVETVEICAICPQSLAFRSIVLPQNFGITLKANPQSRVQPEISVDGRVICQLDASHELSIDMSPFPVPVVNRLRRRTEWIRNVKRSMKFSTPFGESRADL